MNLTERDEARFWSKVALPSGDGCMLWAGALSSAGYGRLYMKAKAAYAHRVSYVLAYGQIPAGLEVDHLCRVRHCVAPLHLEAVTHQVNMLRGLTPAAAHAAKTHCPQGHPYAGDNLYVRPKSGTRHCRTCHREGKRERRKAA